VAEIETLTPAQWQQVAEIRAKYLAATLCTDPVDRPAAEAAITRVYRLYGRPAPRFEWVASPVAALSVLYGRPAPRFEWVASPGPALSVPSPAGGLDTPGPPAFVADVRDRGSHLEDGLPHERRPEALPSSWSRRGDNLSDGLRHALRSRLRVACSTWDLVWDGAAESLSHPWKWVKITTGRHQGKPWYGEGSDYSELAFCDALRRLGIVSFEPDENERLDLLVALAARCGSWSPYQRVCLVCERPSAIHVEAAWPHGPHGMMRLHNADGPAIMFRDGWREYAWHGTRVPAGLIEDGWDLDHILTEYNNDLRRCAIERLGWDRLEADLAAVAVAPDPGKPGTGAEAV